MRRAKKSQLNSGSVDENECEERRSKLVLRRKQHGEMLRSATRQRTVEEEACEEAAYTVWLQQQGGGSEVETANQTAEEMAEQERRLTAWDVKMQRARETRAARDAEDKAAGI
jgi:hypothetical protein